MAPARRTEIRSAPAAELVTKRRLPAWRTDVTVPGRPLIEDGRGPVGLAVVVGVDEADEAPGRVEVLPPPGLGSLVPTRSEPSESCCMLLGKFSPVAKVVTRKSAGLTLGSPPTANGAASRVRPSSQSNRGRRPGDGLRRPRCGSLRASVKERVMPDSSWNTSIVARRWSEHRQRPSRREIREKSNR